MATSSSSTPKSTLGGISVAYVFFWGIAAIALLALAAPFPNMATAVISLLIVGTVLINYQDYQGLFTPPAK